MANFPNTLFKIAGYFAITNDHVGSGFAVFECIENERSFFVQEVVGNKIAEFIPFDLEFDRTNRYADQVARIGNLPIYCFIDRADILIGGIEYIAQNIRVANFPAGAVGVQYSQRYRDAFLKFGRSIFSTSKIPSKVCEFFRQNNVLRSLAIENLPT